MSFPIKNGGSFHSYVVTYIPEGTLMQQFSLLPLQNHVCAVGIPVTALAKLTLSSCGMRWEIPGPNGGIDGKMIERNFPMDSNGVIMVINQPCLMNIGLYSSHFHLLIFFSRASSVKHPLVSKCQFKGVAICYRINCDVD